jgi:protoheme ferro-lyase
MDDVEDQAHLYRIQLLQAFDLKEWDESSMNTTIQALYEKLKDIPDFNAIFAKARENPTLREVMESLHASENDVIFNLLFQYDYFDLLHRCIVDYMLNQSLHPRYLTNLVNAL